MRNFSRKLARFIERHPVWFVIIAVIITAALTPGLTLLETETGFSALVSEDADISVNNARYQEQFGGESINVMFTGQLDEMFSTQNLASLAQVEQKLRWKRCPVRSRLSHRDGDVSPLFQSSVTGGFKPKSIAVLGINSLFLCSTGSPSLSSDCLYTCYTFG